MEDDLKFLLKQMEDDLNFFEKLEWQTQKQKEDTSENKTKNGRVVKG
jgi:hypothetical protein